LGRIRLEPGDVLLVAGAQGSINEIRSKGQTDVIVLSGSKKELPLPKKAPIAGLIFLVTILLASTGILSIAVASITGAVLLVATGCLNIRQATRAIDRKILLLVGSMLALGVALQASGGATFIADLMLQAPFADKPLYMAALLFIIVAFCTNVLSNNACAILFTPIAMNMAVNMGADPIVFAITVIFAANCSFASPIGYKTNLLVMGPGHYRFRDFMKAGVPLVLVLWIAYIFIAKFYYNL
jgi:di/tricarboxylate transporter